MDGLEKGRVRSVQTTLSLIHALRDLGAANLPELAEYLDMPTSTVHNHIRTLADEAYVISDGEQYRLGLRFLELGGGTRGRLDLYKHGRPEVDSLAASTGELANIMCEEADHGAHIYLAKGEDAVVFDTHAGKRYPLHNNALGKAILAHLPAERTDSILSTLTLTETTGNTITDIDELHDELEQIRERGYALDDEERISGLRCVAAPVVVDDDVLGSVSVSGPATRIKGKKFRERYPEEVTRAADIIGINIQYD